MTESPLSRIAIVDHGLGNLFSVAQACRHSGLLPVITQSEIEIQSADAVILPGVGAFGDAMKNLSGLGLVKVLQTIAKTSKPLIGICLGMQLMMTKSEEFGTFQGLNIIEGEVLTLETNQKDHPDLKIPHVGWNQILPKDFSDNQKTQGWESPLLAGVSARAYMYFVHSFYAKPVESNIIDVFTVYGGFRFCSGYRQGNVFGFQFHPERSGMEGLKIYQNLSGLLSSKLF